MAPPEMHTVLIPILNKSVTTFRGPGWFLDDSTYVEKIYAEHYGACHRDFKEDQHGIISIDSKCVYISKVETLDFDEFAKKTLPPIKFSLNVFKADNPALMPYAIFIKERGRSQKVDAVISVESIANLDSLRLKTYKLKSKVDKPEITAFYKVVKRACVNNPSLLFTLNRFNSSLTRADLQDKIVDATISMESLITGKDELRYRFALSNAFLVESEASKRLEVFNILRDLYDTRSGIVHGDMDSKERIKKLNEIEARWHEIMRITTTAITSYVFFLAGNKKPDWDTHLKNLIFGISE